MIDRILEGVDLNGIHMMLTIFGGLLAVYVMQLTHYEAEDAVDPWVVRKFRRLSLAALSLAMLWSAYYSLSHPVAAVASGGSARLRDRPRAGDPDGGDLGTHQANRASLLARPRHRQGRAPERVTAASR